MYCVQCTNSEAQCITLLLCILCKEEEKEEDMCLVQYYKFKFSEPSIGFLKAQCVTPIGIY